MGQALGFPCISQCVTKEQHQGRLGIRTVRAKGKSAATAAANGLRLLRNECEIWKKNALSSANEPSIQMDFTTELEMGQCHFCFSIKTHSK